MLFAQDFVIAEHVSLLRSSDSDFIQELFAESEAEAAEATAVANARGGRRGSKSAFKLNSVGAQFRKQLQARPILPYRLTLARLGMYHGCKKNAAWQMLLQWDCAA